MDQSLNRIGVTKGADNRYYAEMGQSRYSSISTVRHGEHEYLSTTKFMLNGPM